MKKITALALTLMIQIMLPLAASANTCEALFSQGSIEPGKTVFDRMKRNDFGAFWSDSITKIVDGVKSTRAWDQDAKKLPVEKLESWMLAHFFFDRVELAATDTRETMSLMTLWDRPEEASPFRTFKKTFRTILLPKPGDTPMNGVTMESIAKIHRWMMDGKPEIEDAKHGDIGWLRLIATRGFFNWTNVEGINSEQLGKIRNVAIRFTTPVNSPSGRKYLNPYLSTERVGPILNTYYSRLSSIEKVMDKLSPAVQQSVRQAKAENKLNDENEELTGIVIADLLKTAVAEHAAQLKVAKNLDERITAHAEFVWKFVSIHPFVNGNGRTSRAILAQLLMRDGLFPPLLKNQNDVSNMPADFVQQVKDGIILSNLFVSDAVWRAENGWAVEESPVVLTARLPERIYFDSEQPQIGKRYANVDVYDYAQFIRQFEKDRVANPKTETELLREYVKHLQRWTAFRAKTNEEYQVRFVPEEMQSSALQLDATSRERWLRKKYLFYSSDLAWRGLGVNTPMSLDQLLHTFVQPSKILLSMAASRQADTHGDLSHEVINAVSEDFDVFNRAVLTPKDFFTMTNDHMKAEGGYPTSPLLSAAMNRSVADRFSKGFLTNEQSILSQKGQLIVAGLVPQFGTSYFNRLGPIAKRLEVDFASMYPRQVEIAIAGIMAPDSVMRVEYRDVTVKTVIKNTGENMAGETEVHSITVLERSPVTPDVITVTEMAADQTVRSVRKFRITVTAPGAAEALHAKAAPVISFLPIP